MIDKRKLEKAKDLNEFSILESEMLMSWREYNETLKCLRLCVSDARLEHDEEAHDFFIDLIRQHKNDMEKQLEWLDSAERYQMMENLAQSEFVKNTFKMKREEANNEKTIK